MGVTSILEREGNLSIPKLLTMNLAYPRQNVNIKNYIPLLIEENFGSRNNYRNINKELLDALDDFRLFGDRNRNLRRFPVTSNINECFILKLANFLTFIFFYKVYLIK